MRSNLKKLMVVVSAAAAGIIPPVVFAQSTARVTINPNIPYVNPAFGVPGMIQGFYFFALSIAGILAFGAIVYGGVRYAMGRGNPSAESEGRSWITGALLGLLLLGGAYVVLQTINPALTVLGMPTLPGLKGVPTLAVPLAASSTAPANGGTCSVINQAGNYCDVSTVQAACNSWDPNQASEICNKESGGGANPSALSATDLCQDGTSFSIGLWQINVISTAGVPSSCSSFNVNKNPSGPTRVNCGSHYSGTFPQGVCLQCNTNSGGQIYCAKWSCSYSGTSQDYSQCVAGVAALNDQLACKLYNGAGGNFCPWAISAAACGISTPCNP